MKRKRHTPEEIIKKLREAGGLLAARKTVEEVCRVLGTSVATYQRWKSQYGGVKTDALKRLRELEKENARLSEPWPT
jgi:putative transposase